MFYKNIRLAVKSTKKVAISVFLSFFSRALLRISFFCCNFAAETGLHNSTNDL